MTAEEAAALKAAQVTEAEQAGRSGPDADAPIPPPVDDLEPAPAPAPQSEEAPAEPERKEPPKPINPRDAIAARIKAQRDEQNAGLDGDDPQHPPFLRPKQEETPAPAEPVVETPAEAPKLKIKVNGEESEHTRDELVKLAGLDPE